ncbi:MAG: Na(+)/H(+) antiporter subunit E [Candidatus Moanabacter tarae]|uniref:Na(+)/H(+) antiporter subunit E n=1 Tax=Candidatus Moanibacter tarae TaxID=2200854 RepID=A0A2Z4AGZ8_9BACT|nr:MAG: Na(+)/H(+) antiporter subunit E [Candidatus Moanabacter tarae]|tara:strand:- start:3168 stop:3662 length:495 start_codon:yes stop_codon:yes gene_type:complete
MKIRFFSFLILFLVWVVLSGLFDPFHLLLGLFSSIFISLISADLLFAQTSKRFSSRIREGMQVPGYMVWLFYQVVLANIHILRLALSPKGFASIEPRIIRHKVAFRTDFAKYALANSITLTPGTVTVRIDGDHLLIHAISRKTAAGVGGEMEKRVSNVFERDNW